MAKDQMIAKTLAMVFLVACLSSRAGDNPNKAVPREYEGFAEVSQHRGIIDDPDGYVNLRKEPQATAPVLVKVKSNESFSFQRKENDQWCKVKLDSGITGWMHYSRIKLFFTKDDLPPKPVKGDEIDEQARKQGINYYEVTQAAARGDREALKTFFSVGADGAAAEEQVGVAAVVIHLIGDDAFARFLREQPRSFRKEVSLGWELGVVYPFDTEEYFRQHFPKTARILF